MSVTGCSTRSSGSIPATNTPFEIVVATGGQALREHERRGRHDAWLRAHGVERALPVLEPQILPEAQHAQVRAAHQDLLAQLALHARHDAVDHDERATPTTTPPIAITLMNEKSRDVPLLRR